MSVLRPVHPALPCPGRFIDRLFIPTFHSMKIIAERSIFGAHDMQGTALSAILQLSSFTYDRFHLPLFFGA